MKRERAVVCLSGGMDSTVCAALAARDFDAFGLHFSYGQRTEARELQSARAVAERVGLQELMELRTDLFRRIGGSALTDSTIAVPAAATADEEATDEAAAGKAAAHEITGGSAMARRTGAEVPVTYVPFRNAHFLAAAVSWAEVLEASTVLIGAVEQDSSGYPDCRPAYYDAFNALVATGTRDGTIRVQTPLIRLRKAEIVRLGVELGAPLHVSWSCYAGEKVACGVCESCTLRLRAFAEAGTTDLIPYARP